MKFDDIKYKLFDILLWVGGAIIVIGCSLIGFLLGQLTHKITQ